MLEQYTLSVKLMQPHNHVFGIGEGMLETDWSRRKGPIEVLSVKLVCYKSLQDPSHAFSDHAMHSPAAKKRHMG